MTGRNQSNPKYDKAYAALNFTVNIVRETSVFFLHKRNYYFCRDTESLGIIALNLHQGKCLQEGIPQLITISNKAHLCFVVQVHKGNGAHNCNTQDPTTNTVQETVYIVYFTAFCVDVSSVL